MRLGAIVSIGLGDLRLTSKERSAIFWMLVMPIAFIGLFGSMFREEGRGLRRVGLAIVDEDGSFLSRSFVEDLRKENLALRVLTPAARDTAQGVTRTLIVPRGFSDSLASGQRVALKIELQKGRTREYDLPAQISIQKAIIRMLATLAEIDTAGSAETGSVASESFQSRFQRLSERPDLIRTEVRTAGKGRVVPAGFGASAPAMLVMFLLMNTVIYGAVILTYEKQNRCLARLVSAPVSRFDILAGKILGRLLQAFVQSLILLAAGRYLFGVHWGPSPVALVLLLLCLGLCAAALGILLGSVLRTAEQASTLSWIVPLFLSAIGGCWWPLEIVPPWMQVFGHISPAAWAMDGLHGLISFGKGPEAIWIPCLVLLGYATVLTGIGARLLKTE